MQTSLDLYVQEIHTHLKSLSPEEREKEIQEIRLHLNSLVEANRIRGLSEQEAVDLAIRSFDTDRSVARELSRVRLSGRLRALPEAILVALFSESIRCILTVAYITTLRPLNDFIRGSAQVAPVSDLFRYTTLIVGLMSLCVLYVGLGGRGMLREMRSTDTSWGAAVRWQVAFWAINSPYLLAGSLYFALKQTPFSTQKGVVWGLPVEQYTIYQYLFQYPATILLGLVSFWVARALSSKASRGIVIASLVGTVLQMILNIPHLIQVTSASRTPILQFGSMILWPLLAMVLSISGAMLGGKWRQQSLRTA